MMSMTLDNSYTAIRLQPVELKCHIGQGMYKWTILDKLIAGSEEPIAVDRVLLEKENAEGERLYTVFDEEGTYSLRFSFTDTNGDVLTHDFKVYVRKESSAYSPFVSEVLEYRPAPGRQVYEGFDSYLENFKKAGKTVTQDNIISKCRSKFFRNERLFSKGNLESSPSTVSLGAFGGYIVLAFDHSVQNLEGPDIKVYGATEFLSGAQTIIPQPGVVFVAQDVNMNGQHDEDEPWYILNSGSYASTTPGDGPQEGLLLGCNVMYRMATGVLEESTDKMDQEKHFYFPDYIMWSISGAEESSGSIAKLKKDKDFSYWPAWLPESEGLSFENAVRLPNNGVETWNGNILATHEWTWVNPSVQYANTVTCSQNGGLDLSSAIDMNGNPVELKEIHFVKIQTGVCQQIAIDGQCETLVSGVRDLHMPIPKAD